MKIRLSTCLLLLLVVPLIVRCSSLQPPIKAVYVNFQGVNWPSLQSNVNDPITAGYNLIIMAFMDGTAALQEMAGGWANSLSAGARAPLIQNANNLGVSVLLQVRLGDSAFDFTANATQLGIAAAQYVLQNNWNGVDVYLLNVQGLLGTPAFTKFIVDLHLGVRSLLGANYIVTHSPYPTYFASTNNTCYQDVYTQVGSSIDYIMLDYFLYNDPCFEDYNSIFITSTCYPGVSVSEISKYGVPMSKLVVGKPVHPADENPGYVAPSSLHSYFEDAAEDIQWSTGVAGWFWLNNETTMSNWLSTIYALDIPSTPAHFNYTTRTGNGVALVWDPPYYNGNSAITSYSLSRDGVFIYSGPLLSFSETVLSPGITYTYKIYANNSVGQSPASTLPISTISPPPPPGNPMFKPTSARSVLIAWQAAASTQNAPVSNYVLERSNSSIYIGTAPQFQDVTLLPGTTYVYSVMSSNIAGNSAPVSNSFALPATTPLPPLFIPQQESITANIVVLYWSPSTDTGGAAIISYTVVNADTSEIVCQGLQLSCNISGLSPATTYHFIVAASNSLGMSNYSTALIVTTLGDSAISGCPPNQEMVGSACACKSGYVGGGCTSLVIIIVAVVVPIVVVGILLAAFFVWRRNREYNDEKGLMDLSRSGSAQNSPYSTSATGTSGPRSPPLNPIELESEYLTTNLITEYEDIKIVRKLGTGGSGIVYVGIWRNIEVAVKEYKDQNIQTTDFIRESEIHAKLRHPNVVQLFAICLPPHLSALSEFMHKGSLTDVLEAKPPELTWEKKCRMVLDIARGMDYLHKSKILHRDLKSQNCLVDKNWVCKIADFGTSKVINEDAYATVYVPRTAQWTAPEVITQNCYSEKSDVYSFGVIMWEVATGKLPYEGMFAFQVEDRTVQGIRLTVPEGVESWYEVLMQSCWHKDAQERPSFDEILKCLHHIDNSEPEPTQIE